MKGKVHIRVTRGLASAALIAFALGAGALEVPAAVYELQLQIQTTAPVEAKLKASSNSCGAEGEVVYRSPKKMKLRAILYGSACEANRGAVVWNETTREQYSAEFLWDFLNRIGRDGKDAEGLWSVELKHANGQAAGYLYGGGTGKIKGEQIALSGNLAGYMYAGEVVRTIKDGDCKRCERVEVSVVSAAAWGICDCQETANGHTVAHGTWTMKYNGKASEKYDKTPDIASAFAFPGYVRP